MKLDLTAAALTLHFSNNICKLIQTSASQGCPVSPPLWRLRHSLWGGWGHVMEGDSKNRLLCSGSQWHRYINQQTNREGSSFSGSTYGGLDWLDWRNQWDGEGGGWLWWSLLLSGHLLVRPHLWWEEGNRGLLWKVKGSPPRLRVYRCMCI